MNEMNNIKNRWKRISFHLIPTIFLCYIPSDIPNKIIPSMTIPIMTYCFTSKTSFKKTRDKMTENNPWAAMSGAAMIAFPANANT